VRDAWRRVRNVVQFVNFVLRIGELGVGMNLECRDMRTGEWSEDSLELELARMVCAGIGRTTAKFVFMVLACSSFGQARLYTLKARHWNRSMWDTQFHFHVPRLMISTYSRTRHIVISVKITQYTSAITGFTPILPHLQNLVERNLLTSHHPFWRIGYVRSKLSVSACRGKIMVPARYVSLAKESWLHGM
jgi:hypothetical protein